MWFTCIFFALLSLELGRLAATRRRGGFAALAAFRRVLFASMLFLCLLVDSAVAGPCRDRVDLNALGPRHSEPRKLRRIAAEGFVFARCVMLFLRALE